MLVPRCSSNLSVSTVSCVHQLMLGAHYHSCTCRSLIGDGIPHRFPARCSTGRNSHIILKAHVEEPGAEASLHLSPGLRRLSHPSGAVPTARLLFRPSASAGDHGGASTEARAHSTGICLRGVCSDAGEQ